MKKITPFLWFDNHAEEAMNFYISVFENSEVLGVTPGPNGIPQWVSFRLEDQEFIGLNAGPQFKFNESISFFVDCKNQEEVDYFWEKLAADGGEESMCGWLKDKYGLWWQIIPSALMEMLGDSDPQKAKRATDAMLKMQKIVIADLREAYEGE
jgi:predicted 3-demethylubiquinone-9 3-methyltransferase (glyoxalase superfamily)